jgi:PAT family beta-lactamase induction signal transducer AmpG
MRVEGIEIATIGFFAWAHLPYTFKFLWAPLLDRFRVPFLGRRRGWMLLWQLTLVVGIAGLGLINPSSHVNLLFAVALIVAICAASLDIVVDAYRTEILEPHERGPGGALYVTGYRAALVLSGAGVLILADYMSWSEAYFLLAGIMLITVVVTFMAAPAPKVVGSPKTLAQAAWRPLHDLATRQYAIAICAFLLLYKLGENIAGHLIHPFLIDVGFSTSAVGAINKGVGLPAAIAGTLLGGFAVTRLGVKRSLLIFGVLQAAPNLLYAYQYQAGPDHALLAFIVTTDQFCNGLATAALVVFLMSLCDRRFTAFQYAALSSITSVLGRIVSGWSGVIQESIGWPMFFAGSALGTLPALALLMFLPTDIGATETKSVTMDEEQ